MSRILIAYDTTEGQTRKMALHLAEAITVSAKDTSKNHEYTDWTAVDRFVKEFLVHLEQHAGQFRSR